MSKTLFVDIDDTLILYDDGQTEPHPYGYDRGIPWTINEKLLQGIKDFIEENPDELVVLWSGGGKDYAYMWAQKVGLLNPAMSFNAVMAMTKDRIAFHMIREGDIVVDDMDLGGLRTHKPDEWPEEGEK